jgi:hypothetical protein
VNVGSRNLVQEMPAHELVQVVHQTGSGIGSLATGLVALAGGSSSTGQAEALTAASSPGRRAP